MKLTRMLAVGAAAALVGVSTLAIGGSASADDFYVDDSEFGAVADGDPYLPGWFTGDVGAAPGTFQSTPSGLSFVGPFQILNGTPGTGDLTDLVAGAELNVVSGEIAFQIPIFANGTANTGYTTLVPVDPGNAGLHRADDGWTSSNDILADDGTTVLIRGGDSQTGPYYSLQDIETALLDSLTDPYEILAFGAYLPLNKSAVVSSITWAGNTHWFLPAAPTATITPASITAADLSNTTKGVTAAFTGYVPGEDVIIGMSSPFSAGIVATLTADANGAVSYTYVSGANPALGAYDVTATGVTSGVQITGSFTVIANPAELAATGADFTPAIITGSALLLLGGGFVLTGRRRAAAHRS